MAVEVKIIEDSISKKGNRITTFQLKYWRAIHSEFMTHRLFSRNASSSRAIPFKRMLSQVWNDPAGPIFWGSNQPGMQSHKELFGFKLHFCKFMWKFIGKCTCILAWITNYISSPHKQIINRLLEPWQYINVIVTATEWDNFFDLRCHKDAQPEIQELAMKMKMEMYNSEPEEREWHLPYITTDERLNYPTGVLCMLSAARCARVSYLTHDKREPLYQEDMELAKKLSEAIPPHMSPFEHQAIQGEYSGWYNNFKYWKQHRYLMECKNGNNIYE